MFIFRNLRTKVLLSAIVPAIVAAVVVGFIALYAYEQVARDVVEQRDAELASIAAARVSESLTRQIRLLQDVAFDPEVQTMEVDRVTAKMDESMRDLFLIFDAGVAVFDADRRLIWADSFTQRRSELGFPVASELKKIQASRRPSFSNVYHDAITDEDVIQLSVPVLGSGDLYFGTVIGIIDVRRSLFGAIADVLEFKAGSSGFGYLVDGNGRVVYHRNSTQLARDLSNIAPVTRATIGETGASITKDPDGLTVVSGFAPVPGTSWGLVTQEEWENIIAPIRSRGLQIVGLLGLGGILAAGAMFLAVGRMLGPVKDLTAGAERIAGGDFDHRIDAKTGDEIQTLANGFNTMAKALKESYSELEDRVASRTAELRESEERLRTVITAAPIILFAVDNEGVFTLSEGTGLKALGLKPGEVVGQSAYEFYRDVPGIEESIRQALEGVGIATQISIGELTYDTRISPIYDEDGQVTGVIGVATDITEQKRAEEAERSRSQELDTLLTVASTLVEPGSIEDHATRVIEDLAKATEAEWVGLRLWDEKEQGLRLVASVGAGLEEYPPARIIRGGQLLSGTAFETGGTVVTDDYAAYPNADPRRVASGIKSAVSLLMKSSEGAVVGTINVNSSKLAHFTPERVRFLNAVADGMGVLMENARLLEEVRENEEKFRTLFEQSMDAIFIIHQKDGIGNLVDCNRACLELFGFESVQGLNNHVAGLFVDSDVDERLRRVLDEKGAVSDFEVRFRKFDGSVMDCLMTAVAVDGEGGVDIIQGVVRDITERKRAEQAILESEAEARRLAQENSVMADVGRIVSSSLDIDEGYDAFAEQVNKLVPFDAISIILVEPDEQTFNIAYFSGTEVPEWQRGQVYPMDGSATKEAYSSRSGILFHPEIEDQVVKVFPGLLSAFRAGIVSFLLTPLILNDKPIGVVFLASATPNAYDEKDLLVTDRVGSQIAGAIANAQLYNERTVAEAQLRTALGEKDTLLQEIQGHYQQEQRRADQLTLISDVGRRLTSILDADELLTQVSGLIKDSFDYYRVAIAIVDGDDLVFRPDVNPEFQNLGRRTLTDPDVEPGITGWVATHGEPILAPDVAKDPHFFSTPDAADTRSELCVPIERDGQVVAILDIQSDRLDDFDESDVAVIQSLANQIGIAMENARLFRAEQRRAEQFRVVGEASRRMTSILSVDELLSQIGNLIQETFGYYHVGIGLIEDDEVVYKIGAGVLWDNPEFQFEPPRLKVGEQGISGRVAANREPMLVPDVDKEPDYVGMRHSLTRSELAVPIMAKGDVIGVLDVQSKEVDSFDEGDLVMMQSLANEAGIAIQNARLFEAEQHRVEQMRAINDVAIRVSSVLNLDELLSEVAQLLHETFGYSVVNVFMADDNSEKLHLRSAHGTPPSVVEPGYELEIGGKGIVAWVAESGEPLVVNDVSKEPRYFAPDEPWEDIKSELTVPIKRGGNILGVLDLESTDLNAFSESDRAIVQAVANQLAVGIENAQRFDETRDLAILEERNRMAREMHDTLAQGFTGIVLQLEAGEDALQDNPADVREHLSRAKDLARHCLQEARRSVWNLLPQALEDNPLHVVLQDEIDRFNFDDNLSASLVISGFRRPLATDVQAAILRICQESMINIRKHAKATEVTVKLVFEPDSVRLEVEDNGRGFDPEAVGPVTGLGGFGLTGMRQRAGTLHGELTLDSNIGTGTRLKVTIPTS